MGDSRRLRMVGLLVMVVAAAAVVMVESNSTVAWSGTGAATDKIEGHPEEAKVGIDQVGEEITQEATPWTEWAKEKIQKGLGLKNSADDAAADGNDNIQQVVSGTCVYYPRTLLLISHFCKYCINKVV